MPFNSPFMSLTFSRYVRFVFHVCPVLSLRVISLHLPSCRLVSLCFVSLSFPLHSPCFHFCPFQFPFVSLSFPAAFLSCRLPISSAHLLALPCVSPSLPNIPAKKHGFSSVFAIRASKNTEFFQIFGKRRQEPQTSKEPAGGIEPGTPVSPAPRRLRLVERHQIAARPWGGGAGGGVRGGVVLYPLLGVRHNVGGFLPSSSPWPWGLSPANSFLENILLRGASFWVFPAVYSPGGGCTIPQRWNQPVFLRFSDRS